MAATRAPNVKYHWRTLAAVVHDLAASAVAWLLAFGLRFNLEVPEYYVDIALRSLACVVPVNAVVFHAFGLYRGIWRYASLPDLRRILYAVSTASAVALALLVMLQIGVPRSVLIANPIFLVVLMGGSRLAYRAWKERRLGDVVSGEREPVFVIGTEVAAANLVRELARSSQWHVVGVFDDDASVHGRELHGVKVVGHTTELAAWRDQLGARNAIIAMPAASHQARRQVVTRCSEAGLKVFTVPSFDDLMSGRVTVSQIRHVELDDLLGRDAVVLDTTGLSNWIGGRTVMVTGAGGSIGAELCRQLARFGPRRIVFFELNEFALYTIEQEFRERLPEVPIVSAIGDVKDEARLNQVLAAQRPSVVFHAAAYKHVPLMESENAWQAVVNNVLGTIALARASIAHGVEKFVLVSTDKAVNPTNVMGASKRLAEMACQALQQTAGATQFVLVRFGNVLGSTGSVIPRFREQIARGGPVTVTHPEITRYFMSIPEAVQLVLQAGLMGRGGEVFVLDMGEPVRIVDLAREMIRLSGFTESDIRIVYTGLRPGEKLFEEPLGAGEDSLPTPHPKLRIARVRQENGDWLARIERSLRRPEAPSDESVRAELARWVPEYTGR